MRIALVTEVPAPFRLPAFSALASCDGVALRAFFLAERDPRRQYVFNRGAARFPWEVLRGRNLRRGGLWVAVNSGVGRSLRAFAPDVILVGGWNQPAFWRSRRFARRHRVPLVVWVESTSSDARSGHALPELLKRRFLASASAALVPGRAAASYVRDLGVDPTRIAVAPNSVDLSLFDERVAQLRVRRDELRRERGLAGFVVLSVGRLEHEKGADLLPEAMREVDGTLVVVGAGSLRPQLEREGGARLRLVGHVPPDELPAWYASADAFVLPSRSETWGMVLNEAACAGLPLVVSSVAGAGLDLVDEGVNGFRVPPDSRAIGEALGRVASDEAIRTTAATRSRELVAPFTPEAWAATVASLAQRVAG